MSDIPDIKIIIDQLKDHEDRIRMLEKVIQSTSPITTPSSKQVFLPELIRDKHFKSGQEKIAVIVGYYEKLINQLPVSIKSIKDGWKMGKFDGKYDTKLLARAIKDGLVRNIDENLDLSQTGEKFFNNFLKQDGRN